MNGRGWDGWRRQLWVIARQEVGRSIFSRRSLPVLLLIGMPISLAVMRALFLPESLRSDPGHTTGEFAQMFYFFMLRFIVFFASALLFVKLFRGEILERSLLYTLLAPIRREVLVAGKYLGGAMSALLILLPTTALTLVLFYLPHGRAGLDFVMSATGLGHFGAYLLVVALACLAYGALFTLAGLFFRNPMVPAILFLGWEVAAPFLPPFLKAFGIVHYLGSLTPVPPAMGPLALLAQPVNPWLAVFGLLVAVIVLLAACAQKAKRLEVTYSAD